MLEIIAIGFVGSMFFRLAKEYNKIAWLFAILGGLSFYAGVFLAGMAYGWYIASSQNRIIDDSDMIGLIIAAYPAGAICCVIFYQLLKRAWKKKAEAIQEDATLLDDGDLLE